MVSLSAKALLIGGVLAAFIAVGAVAKAQHSRAERLQETVEQQTQIIKQQNDAARIHRATLRKLQTQNAELEIELGELANMEGRDAPLSDLLRATGAAADRLR